MEISRHISIYVYDLHEQNRTRMKEQSTAEEHRVLLCFALLSAFFPLSQNGDTILGHCIVASEESHTSTRA